MEEMKKRVKVLEDRSSKRDLQIEILISRFESELGNDSNPGNLYSHMNRMHKENQDRMISNENVLNKLNDYITGNGKPGLKTDMEVAKKDIAHMYVVFGTLFSLFAAGIIGLLFR